MPKTKHTDTTRPAGDPFLLPGEAGKIARIPADVCIACEKKARAHRKKTGNDRRWTQVLIAAARKQLKIG